MNVPETISVDDEGKKGERSSGGERILLIGSGGSSVRQTQISDSTH